MSDSPLLQVAHLSKAYGGVQALCDVSLELYRAEVHALCGENGAGKSTLIKLLTGVVAPDAGTMILDGHELPPGNVHQAEARGVAVVHQESTAFPDLDAVDNVFVGRELTKLGGLRLQRSEMKRQTAALLAKLGERIDLARPLGELPLAQRQMVALARALLRRCKLLIMDEPTASLSARETQVLLRVVRQLRDEGIGILYVSHRLDEVFQIADRVTVLRDGRWIATRETAQLDAAELIRLMVGREMAEPGNRQTRSRSFGEAALEVRGLSRAGAFDDISLTVRAGEIVGLAGLVGAGRSELARAVFGIDRYDAGSIAIAGERLPPGSVAAALRRGLALVPEDRQHEGLILPMTVSANLSLAVLRTLTRGGFLSRRGERQLAERQLAELAIKPAQPAAVAATLSGGNQQKVVLGKWLACRPRVLILDEPTRGVDVGAKAQVHGLVRQLAAQGLATLVISSDLPELLAVSDRILVMRQGRLAGELPAAAATQEQVLALALPEEREGVVAA